MVFSQVTALSKGRPTGNPHRYPHVAHRFTAPLHKSSTGLRTGKPLACRGASREIPAPLPGPGPQHVRFIPTMGRAAATGQEVPAGVARIFRTMIRIPPPFAGAITRRAAEEVKP